MSGTKPVRCQKCGKPLGYITVFAKGLILSTYSERENSCYLYGMLSERKIARAILGSVFVFATALAMSFLL